MEKISELIIKGELRLCQLAGIKPGEIMVLFTNDEIKKYGKAKNPGKELVLILGEKLITSQVTMAHSFNLRNKRQFYLCEFKASLL